MKWQSEKNMANPGNEETSPSNQFNLARALRAAGAAWRSARGSMCARARQRMARRDARSIMDREMKHQAAVAESEEIWRRNETTAAKV